MVFVLQPNGGLLYIAIIICLPLTSFCSCEAGWIPYDVSCYKYNITTKANWTDARTACRNMGADLVVVKDQKENDFLNTRVPSTKSVWLGLAYITNEGDFVWVDSGEFSNYTNYRDGKPNNTGNREDCIEMQVQYAYKWNDIPCSKLRTYVCEKKRGTNRPICPSPVFNDAAETPSECIDCFCFGITSTCYSSGYNETEVSIPFNEEDNLFGVQLFRDNDGNITQVPSQYLHVFSASGFIAGRDLFRLPDGDYYWFLPSNFTGNRLTSYGLYLSYSFRYTYINETDFKDDVYDVLLKSGDIVLSYKDPVPAQAEAIINRIIPLKEADWVRLSVNPMDPNGPPKVTPVSRAEFMLVLQNIRSFQLQASYDRNTRDFVLYAVSMGTTINSNTGEGRAYMVEDCQCPLGYMGLSCERCGPGYYRDAAGNQYLGTCTECIHRCNGNSGDCHPDTDACRNCGFNTAGNTCDICADGFYGDPLRGIDCRPCPCPLEIESNQFSRTCYLDPNDGLPTCDRCPQGHEGRRCERCSNFYVGDPQEVGSSCNLQESKITATTVQPTTNGERQTTVVSTTIDPTVQPTTSRGRETTVGLESSLAQSAKLVVATVCALNLSTTTTTTVQPTASGGRETADVSTTRATTVQQTTSGGRETTVATTVQPTTIGERETTVDTIPPNITCQNDITTEHLSPYWQTPIATDETGIPSVSCTSQPNARYPVGSVNEVTCTAEDLAQNTADCSFLIIIQTDLTEEIANITLNVTENNVDEVASKLYAITESAEVLEPADVIEVSNGLDDIVAINSTNENVTEAVIDTIDNLFEFLDDENTALNEATASILGSLEQQIGTSASDGQNYTKQADNFAVQTKSFNARALQSDVVFSVNENTMDTCLDNCEQKKSELSIRLPKNILTGLDGTQVNVSFIVFHNDVLFPSENVRSSNRSTSGVVLAATVYDDSLPEVFEEPVELVFAVPTNLSAKHASCVFWNETLNDWSPDGCKTHTDEGDKITCQCTHLTNFAVLMFPTNTVIQESVKIFLDVVTYIGCSTSIICLSITLITILSAKTIRNRQPQKIMINLCISLLCLYVVFILGVDQAEPGSGACKAVAAFVHYFLLTSVAWTLVEAINMYILFIKVFHVPGSKFLWIAVCLAWGAPLLCVIVLFIVSTDFYDNETYCYINSSKNTLLVGCVIIPISVILFCNSIIFVMVIKKLFLQTRVLGKNAAKSRNENKKRVLNAIAISCLLGLTWVFGFLAFEHDAQLPFLIPFCVFNTFQGGAIFYLFCFRRSECKDVWRSWYHRSKKRMTNILCRMSLQETALSSVTDVSASQRTGKSGKDISLSVIPA